MVLFVKPGHCNTFKYTNLIYSGQQCACAGKTLQLIKAWHTRVNKKALVQSIGAKAQKITCLFHPAASCKASCLQC